MRKLANSKYLVHSELEGTNIVVLGKLKYVGRAILILCYY